MKHSSSEERKAINVHLHRMHSGFCSSGSTLNRMVDHDLLHADGPAGTPPHVHPEAGSLAYEAVPESAS